MGFMEGARMTTKVLYQVELQTADGIKHHEVVTEEAPMEQVIRRAINNPHSSMCRSFHELRTKQEAHMPDDRLWYRTYKRDAVRRYKLSLDNGKYAEVTVVVYREVLDCLR